MKKLDLTAIIFFLGAAALGQVMPISNIKDPQGRILQQKYATQLQALGADASRVHFPYPFYFSAALDVDEAAQKKLPQGSIRFDRVEGRVVLEITGNYYISYSAKSMTPNQRARQTFTDVVLPLLKVAVAHIDRSIPFDSYGFEIAHHVRNQVLKVDTEGPENFVLIVSRSTGERLAQANDVESRQAALLESAVYLNSEPLTLWLTGDEAPADVKDRYLARRAGKPDEVEQESTTEPGSLVSSRLIPETELAARVREYQKSQHDLSPLRLEKLETKYGDTSKKIVAGLNAQAHFVAYAPPAFIAFRDGAYLQFSMTTDLEQPAGQSQYRIAALAFDTHIAHLLRPISSYFHDNPQFEGIDLSTTVHQAEKPNSESVEFVVPFAALACYEKYDCTGQELINRSIVLINGERVSLDLQKAEGDVNAGVR
ncbi:MAG TPA: hypothetical protein VKW06_07705 [Candidatus Angelobacter sp.]|nr:hypothetical protein [Candidatus Angelobacter sp.]